MSCCLESAIITALRALECTPIRSENHFIIERKCKDCIPYVVVKVSTTAGLRTSSAVQKISSVEINAYFSSDKEQQAIEYRDLVDGWLSASGCVDLGECGCLCMNVAQVTKITVTAGGLLRVSFTFSGRYHQAELSSVSESV